MAKNWKKCPDPEHSKIHQGWFSLEYYLSGYGVYCFSDDCSDCKSCCLGESGDCIGQYFKDTKVYCSADGGKTKKIVEIDMLPSKIEFITLLTQEKIERFAQRLR